MALSVSRDADTIISDLFENFDAPEIRRELTSCIAHCKSIIATDGTAGTTYPGAAESLKKYEAALERI